MPFNASKSGVKDARNELNQLEQWVSACNDRCSDVNTSFAAIMAGSWADAEVSAAIQLQTYLLIYTQALEQTHTTYDDMITELDGTLSTARDALAVEEAKLRDELDLVFVEEQILAVAASLGIGVAEVVPARTGLRVAHQETGDHHGLLAALERYHRSHRKPHLFVFHRHPPSWSEPRPAVRPLLR